MSVEALSRIQFATVAIFHFLFVPLTLASAPWWLSWRPATRSPATKSTCE